ncbi:hypothetical protein [Micromonospora sp. WMMD708]|uniref:hypothetical protein n=1 Tax=Micromonospora sp. WMMD708 TaxID=3403464 RepID=UPI003BF4BEB8
MAIRRVRSEVDRRQFGHVRVWREDLAAIVSTVSEVATDIKLATGDFMFDSVEDLAEVKSGKVDVFVLTAAAGNIKLKLGLKVANLAITDPDLRTRGMATEIERILRMRKRRIRHLLPYVVFVGLGILSGCAAILGGIHPTIFFDEEKSVSALGSSVFGGLLGVGFSLMVGLGMSSMPKNSAIVHTQTHEQAPPWGKRNKDALVTNAIVSLVFLVIGVLVGYLLPK